VNVVNLVLIVLNKINGIHNVYPQPLILLLDVEKNGLNVEEKIGQVLDVVKQDHVLKKMIGILNV